MLDTFYFKIKFCCQVFAASVRKLQIPAFPAPTSLTHDVAGSQTCAPFRNVSFYALFDTVTLL